MGGEVQVATWRLMCAADSIMATLVVGGYVVSDVVASNNVVTSKKVLLMMIGGRAWSPGVYQAVQVLGNLLDVPWKRAFVSLTFI
jgi:hypothetical protein